MNSPASFLADLAEDADTLARLHDREIDAGTIAALKEIGFPANLALLPQDADSAAAWAAMRGALDTIPQPPDDAELDSLAVDFAAIYLTGAYGASPCESFWLDPDHIVCQQPMFEVRAAYKAAGLAAANWRVRPDDHLVLQLQYLAHMLRRPAGADFPALAAFMDAHLLRWLPDFATRVAASCEHPFHAALAAVTLAWCRGLRGAV